MDPNSNNDNTEQDAQHQSSQQRRVQKFATLTVCLVPPSSSETAWDYLTKARTQLKDPGLFRWPPHANLLYPFVNITPRDGNDEDKGSVDTDILGRLHQATKQVDPFTVKLEHFGTFGGNKRGVLWLYPSSSNLNGDDEGEPVHHLYKSLVQQFPECNSSREFNPHMTLSHFACLGDAKAAQEEVEDWWTSSSSIEFPINEIYLLERKGDDGQFLRRATLGLGALSCIEVHDPPLPFPKMPVVEEEWVRAERMALKARRNSSSGGGRRGGKRRGGRRKTTRDRGPSRTKDTPEEIAAKRAARKAKREKLLAEQTESEGN